MNAFFLSHNGLGDNLYSVGALRFLLGYYKNIHFLCKDKYYDNVKLFFSDEKRIICVPFDSKREFQHCYEIIMGNYTNNDIFICGSHKNYLNSKITNTELLAHKMDNSKYTIDYDTIRAVTSDAGCNYDFIRGFYNDINLDLSVFFEHFDLKSTETSKKIYESVKKYDVIFLQTTSSDNIKLNIDDLVRRNIDKEDTILISNDENLYEDADNEKYKMCQSFLRTEIVNYIDIIQNSKEIYIIDSCFTGIVLPLKKTNRLKADIVRIIRREEVHKYQL
tara:strand:+ start:2034 stop:2864 length:831 start_codon:yes stop_codon:yes gene_type:complete